VNGNLLSDVNSISLYDIEEVSFTRTNLNGKYFPFSRAGIFFITTKKNNTDRVSIRFNSQYNTTWNNDYRLPPPGITGLPGIQVVKDDADNKSGHWLSNHLSLSFQKKKWQLYSAFQYDDIKGISGYRRTEFSYSGFTDTITSHNRSKHRNLKLFVNVIYKFSDKLEGGISGYYAGQKWKAYSASENRSSTADNAITSPLHHYNGAAFIKWNPVSRIYNILSFEYTNDQLDQTSQWNSVYFQSPGSNISRLDNISSYLKQTLFRNRFQYTFAAKNKFTAETGLTFSYLRQNLAYDYYSAITSFPPASNSFYYGNNDFRFTTFTPDITLDYAKTISLHGGYGFILNNEFKDATARSKNNFFTNLELDLKNAFHISDLLKQLTLSFSYSDLVQNLSTSYWLNNHSIGQPFYPWWLVNGAGFTFPGNPAPKREIFKNQLAGIQLNMQVTSRLSFMAGWSKLQSDGLRLYNNNTAISGPFAKIKSSESGFMLSGNYQVIDKTGKSWMTGINLAFPRTEIKETASFSRTDVYYKTMIGLNNSIRLNKFSAQLTILAGNGREVYNYNNIQRTSGDRAIDFLLRYLMIGYDFTSHFKVFIHAKNIASNKDQNQYYQYDRYAGIGINIFIL
jgi:hypothetical protein